MEIRERIMHACRELMAERGLHGLKMDELSARAGISKRTLYRYFPSKDELIATVFEGFMMFMAQEQEKLLASGRDPAELMKEFLQTIFTHSRFITGPNSLRDLQIYYPGLWEKIDRFRLERFKLMLGYFSQYYLKGQDPGIDMRILTAAALASVQAVINPAFLLENNLTFKEAIEQLSQVFLSIFQKRR